MTSKPCEWCNKTSDTIDSQEYEIEKLKEKLNISTTKDLVWITRDEIKELQDNRDIIDDLKQKNIQMKRECNNRYSEQLQLIRKLQAQVMLQVQPELFKENE